MNRRDNLTDDAERGCGEAIKCLPFGELPRQPPAKTYDKAPCAECEHDSDAFEPPHSICRFCPAPHFPKFTPRTRPRKRRY